MGWTAQPARPTNSSTVNTDSRHARFIVLIYTGCDDCWHVSDVKNSASAMEEPPARKLAAPSNAVIHVVRAFGLLLRHRRYSACAGALLPWRELQD